MMIQWVSFFDELIFLQILVTTKTQAHARPLDFLTPGPRSPLPLKSVQKPSDTSALTFQTVTC